MNQNEKSLNISIRRLVKMAKVLSRFLGVKVPSTPKHLIQKSKRRKDGLKAEVNTGRSIRRAESAKLTQKNVAQVTRPRKNRYFTGTATTSK